MSILVFNAGSSTLKFGLFTLSCGSIAEGVVDWRASRMADLVLSAGGEESRQAVEVWDYDGAVREALRALTRTGLIEPSGEKAVRAVGHRVVHGGTGFRDSAVIDERVREAMGALSALAPLHNPPALSAIKAAQRELPGVPHVASFDTAFFSGLPLKRTVYPVPYGWYEAWGIRRYGFHGISHAWCAERAAQLVKRKALELKVITCHLGAGCSVTATRGGKAAATTMGFTPMEGLMMGTRSGSIDPGIILHVQKEKGMSVDEVARTLNFSSGLLGVSGISGDFRRVEEEARGGNRRAGLALEIYAESVRSAIGSMAVALGGVDALVFTAGVGENSSGLRASVCEGLSFLGLKLSAGRNLESRPDADISTDDSPGRILVIRTREELVIARETLRFCRK